MDLELLKNVSMDILRIAPQEPFLCVPMSAMLYAILKDKHNIDAKIITGDLSYNGQIIFKQDFSIAEANGKNIIQEWAGHSWVEIGDFICDLSIFRTIYSEKFNLSCKPELIKTFGKGRGVLFSSKTEMEKFNLSYKAIDNLSDDTATAVLHGFKLLLLS